MHLEIVTPEASLVSGEVEWDDVDGLYGRSYGRGLVGHFDA